MPNGKDINVTEVLDNGCTDCIMTLEGFFNRLDEAILARKSIKDLDLDDDKLTITTVSCEDGQYVPVKHIIKISKSLLKNDHFRLKLREVKKLYAEYKEEINENIKGALKSYKKMNKDTRKLAVDIARQHAKGGIDIKNRQVLQRAYDYIVANPTSVLDKIDFSADNKRSKSINFLKYLDENSIFLKVSFLLLVELLFFKASFGLFISSIALWLSIQGLLSEVVLFVLNVSGRLDKLFEDDKKRILDGTVAELRSILGMNCEQACEQEEIMEDKEASILSNLIVRDMEFLRGKYRSEHVGIIEGYYNLIADYKRIRTEVCGDELRDENIKVMGQLLDLERQIYSYNEKASFDANPICFLDRENFAERLEFMRDNLASDDRVVSFANDAIARIESHPYCGCEMDILEILSIVKQYIELDCMPGEICRKIAAVEGIISKKISDNTVEEAGSKGKEEQVKGFVLKQNGGL